MTKERAKQKAELYLKWAISAEQKAKEIYDKWHSEMKDFDWTQPILRGHHSQKRHEKIYERRNRIHEKVRELENKAKRYREKADNLTRFSNTHKGDAERKRQEKREQADKEIIAGCVVDTVIFGLREVLKVNKKTYTVKGSIRPFTVDKSFCKLYSKSNEN